MKCTILHEGTGRLRVHMQQYRMTFDQADILEQYLNRIPGVYRAEVYDRTANAVIHFTGKREDIIHALSVFHYDDCGLTVSDHNGRALQREYEDKVYWHICRRTVSLLFLPSAVRAVLTLFHAIPFVVKGIRSLLKGKLEVSVLDATTITVSILRRDFNTAGSVIFLLGFSDILEEWTHRKSVDDLARSMSLNVGKVWLKTADGEEVLVPINDVEEGDHIVVRTSNTIPLDGTVAEGEMSANQASMTGESLPVPKSKGSTVFAGTVVEEGECVVVVKKTNGSSRYDRIVKMIEESEKMKSDTEAKAMHLSDSLVPYSFLATGAVYLLTRNVNRALAVLMVDYSCALRLSMPISVLSAMREASRYHISVKGGKFLEAMADAKTIVFDKTGTLTYSKPTVARVVPFGDQDEDYYLKLAACMEEHFPHSIANAVVAAAKKEHLAHVKEMHARVEYIVAHGIASEVDGVRAIIGSYHFVFEDEHCTIPEGKQELFDSLPDEYSHLYLAVGGELAAVILIEDPIRKEAPEVIKELHELGFEKIVMMTGDSERTAKAVAAKVGVDEYHAEVLPEDKAAFVRKEHEAGHGVVMIGDGINDSPALSEADCGIAVSDGAAIAREIADVTIADEDLHTLVVLKDLSNQLMKRIHGNYRFIMTFNSALIILGAMGVLQPTVTAYAHNISTLLISMHSMTSLQDEDTEILKEKQAYANA